MMYTDIVNDDFVHDSNYKRIYIKQIQTMDYEKKYKEALERMKSLARGEHPECFSEAQKAAEFIFPELKESKEEKIKGVFHGWIRTRPDSFSDNGVSREEMLEWLESKGKPKEIDYDEELKKCRANPLYFFDKYMKVKLEKPDTTWKPSEEQLEALKEALGHIPDEYDVPYLTTLYEELKKLMEE